MEAAVNKDQQDPKDPKDPTKTNTQQLLVKRDDNCASTTTQYAS